MNIIIIIIIIMIYIYIYIGHSVIRIINISITIPAVSGRTTSSCPWTTKTSAQAADRDCHTAVSFTLTRRRHQTCHFRKRATSAPAEGPAYGLDFARHCEFPLRALQAQKWQVRESRTLGAAWSAPAADRDSHTAVSLTPTRRHAAAPLTPILSHSPAADTDAVTMPRPCRSPSDTVACTPLAYLIISSVYIVRAHGRVPKPPSPSSTEDVIT